MHKIPCVIFAGGKSRRMGEDKALLDFGGKPLALYQYERLKEIFENVAIATKTKKFDFEAPFIFDSDKTFAPTPVILDIFNFYEEFFAISVDAPFIDKSVIDKIVDTAKKNPHKNAIIAKTKKPQPLIGIYRKSIAPFIEEALSLGDYKLGAILHRADTAFVEFDEDRRFLNLNYPQDFQEALKYL
ncbi:MAG: molybdenum cofactor guanylyltransferase MobA [Epsilonproteobacteria bacterium]|nr:molybdenum cofactor guanylyltransferase MobA [Campylobacterota bacterium]NPA65230.1 molybdenum cofactor guanylyltransferase MobA [Campylobacterota bacterium]